MRALGTAKICLKKFEFFCGRGKLFPLSTQNSTIK